MSLSICYRTEQYGPLRLDEALVYNCIIIVGDFMGVIEELFQAIKVEMKQFSEFENWLEQGTVYLCLFVFTLILMLCTRRG